MAFIARNEMTRQFHTVFVIARSKAMKQSLKVFVIASETKQSLKEKRNFIYEIATLPSVARNDNLILNIVNIKHQHR